MAGQDYSGGGGLVLLFAAAVIAIIGIGGAILWAVLHFLL